MNVPTVVAFHIPCRFLITLFGFWHAFGDAGVRGCRRRCMNRGTLIPSSAEVELICIRPKAGVIHMELCACQVVAVCPSCGIRSSRVHSRYWRTVADLPWEGIPVQISLRARKFFCVDKRCTRRIFTEPLPGTVSRYGRRSDRASDALSWVTLALGGRAGTRLARKLGLLASRTTLLHELRRRAPSSASASPRVLGIDEWAWKKGHRYGTMLCDLEQGRVIDLLPTRDTETVAAWLHQHPSVQVVSRDRASSFADAIRKGAPNAVQVADRWHLMNNLVDTLIRSLERHRGTVREVSDRLEASPADHSPDQLLQTLASQRTQQKRNSRLELYQQMTELIARGKSQSQAAASVGLSLRTVQRWITTGVFPERKHRIFSSQVDAFGPYIEKRVAQGCTNASQLWREIKQQGYRGNISGVWRWLQRRFVSSRTSEMTPPMMRRPPLCLEHVAWLMLKADSGRHRFLKALYKTSPELEALGHTARGFFEMIRNRDAAAWPQWLEDATLSPLASFARQLERDRNAVDAALRLPWSNGMVEGQIHRLKLIKRQMYGRAGFDLLRLRVLNPT
jgi:transposase